MKLLLTSGGVTNPSIHAALVELLGKPVAESNALGDPDRPVGPPVVRTRVGAGAHCRRAGLGSFTGLGWASLGVLELTALPTIGAGTLGPLGARGRRPARRRRRRDLPGPLDARVRAGGPAALADRHGLGGGERRQHGDDAPDRGLFVEWAGAPDDRTLGVVDFSIFPHLNAFPTNTPAEAERWAADLGAPAYAIDEQTAITVVDGRVEVVSEGEWTAFGL